MAAHANVYMYDMPSVHCYALLVLAGKGGFREGALVSAPGPYR